MAAAITMPNQMTVSALGPFSFTASGTLLQQIAITIPATTTDQEFDISFAFADINEVFLVATGDMTLGTDAAGSGASQTFDFVSGIPMIWTDQMPAANPFTFNVTKFFLTNDGATDIILYGYVLTTPP